MSRRRSKGRPAPFGSSKHRKARVQRFRAKQKAKGRGGHMNHKPEELATGGGA